jgi:hypothetical protein
MIKAGHRPAYSFGIMKKIKKQKKSKKVLDKREEM